MKKRREALYGAHMQGGPLDGLDVYTSGQPLLLVDDVIDESRTVCYVRHAYQMKKIKRRADSEDILSYEYVGWLHTERLDIRSTAPELN